MGNSAGNRTLDVVFREEPISDVKNTEFLQFTPAFSISKFSKFLRDFLRDFLKDSLRDFLSNYSGNVRQDSLRASLRDSIRA